MYTFAAINYLLSPAHAESRKFWYVMFSFSFVPRYFLMSLLMSSLTHWLFNSVLLIHICGFFHFLCAVDTVSLHSDWKRFFA